MANIANNRGYSKREQGDLFSQSLLFKNFFAEETRSK